MALISPGTQVTVTDESFFIPAAAATVPLLFIATASEKLQPNGIDPATGTYESNVIRTVTSLDQSVRLYGIPVFKESSTTSAGFHGDSRNEYGLFALNQFLGIGNRAFVVRAGVNLNDDPEAIEQLWENKLLHQVVGSNDPLPAGASWVLYSRVQDYINAYNTEMGFVDPGVEPYRTSITRAEMVALVEEVLTETLGIQAEGLTVYFADDTFKYTRPTFFQDQTAAPLNVYLNGFSNPATQDYLGVVGESFVAETNSTTSGWVTVTELNNDVAPVNSRRVVFVDNSAQSPATGSQIVRRDGGNWSTVLAGDKVIVRYAENALNDGVYTVASVTTTTTANDTINLILTDVVYGDATSSPNDVEDTSVTITIMREVNEGFFTADDARVFLEDCAMWYRWTTEFVNATTLGGTDAQRRKKIVTALASVINSNTAIRSEQYEYNLIVCPGYHELADELVKLAQDIGDEAFVIGDVPMNLDPDEVVEWMGTTSRVSSNNIAYYYPHGIASNLDGKEVFVASSGIALRTYTYSDNVSHLWFAPAGTQRGLVTGISRVGYVKGLLGSPTTFIEAALNQGQRDNMYKYFTNLNPITFFPNRGIIMWGQKTSAPAASALDRVNVARLVGYIKRQLRKNSMPFVFQPNDQITRDQLKAAVDSFLADIVVKRGLYDFATICDETNNTPDRIDRNELFLDCLIKPVKSAEFIYIPIRVVSTAAEI